MTWHLLHAKWVTLGMYGYCAILLTPMQCCELFLRRQEVISPFSPFPQVKRRIEMWVKVCSTACPADSVPLWWKRLTRKSRKQVYFIDMGAFGKRSRGEGNKLFLEYSATRSVQLPPLPNVSSHSGEVCCLALSKKTGMIQRTVVTMSRKHLSCKCCMIKKFFLFLTRSALLSGDSFSGEQKMEHWLLANTDNKVYWSTGLLKLGALLVSFLDGCSGSLGVSNLEYRSETGLISTWSRF